MTAYKDDRTNQPVTSPHELVRLPSVVRRGSRTKSIRERNTHDTEPEHVSTTQ